MLSNQSYFTTSHSQTTPSRSGNEVRYTCTLCLHSRDQGSLNTANLEELSARGDETKYTRCQLPTILTWPKAGTMFFTCPSERSLMRVRSFVLLKLPLLLPRPSLHTRKKNAIKHITFATRRQQCRWPIYNNTALCMNVMLCNTT